TIIYVFVYGNVGEGFIYSADEAITLTCQTTPDPLFLDTESTSITYQWLGNFELRIDMIFNGSSYYAIYNNFNVDSEENQYELTLNTFSGNVYDEFGIHNYMKFSTPDRDNDIDDRRFCSQVYQAGWWYMKCHYANLNGHSDSPTPFKGVTWTELTTGNYSLSSVEMKIRKKN
uniref:Fibrinogen C-terminal domain-containing protein n=1 Tax=Biomphalaria glabrata TaxID=6526 RepID=A0A2C9K2F8_BIOGL